MTFHTPWAFLALLAVPLLFYIRLRRKPASLRFSSTARVARSGHTWKQKTLWISPALRLLALTLLVVALARPQKGMEEIIDRSEGVAIYMVVDHSGSMGYQIACKDGNFKRLKIAKRAFREFVEGNDDNLAGRPNDLIGLISFARYPHTNCPLTLSHNALSQYLEKIDVVKRKEEDGTAIGDALALAAARLDLAEESLAKRRKEEENKYRVKSKIIILLTDGEQNCGERTTKQAAALAKKWGIKLYIIGIVGEAFTTVNGFFGKEQVAVQTKVDEDALKEIAKSTGGIYRQAGDLESLQKVYEEIDKLEKSELPSLTYRDYKERFLPWALAALALIILDVVLTCTVYRRIP